MYFRKALAIICVSLIAMPLWALPAPGETGAREIAGVVESSSDTSLRGSHLVPGTSVYGGDIIEVGGQGSAWISFATSQLLLSADTRVELLKGATEQMQFAMEHGVAHFRSSPGHPLRALLADGTIRPAGPEASGYVSLLNANSGMIGAEKGALVLTTAHDGRSVTIPEGYALSITLADPPAGMPVAAVHRLPSKIILIGALIILAALAAGLIATSQESRHGQPTSPFVP